MIELNKSSCVHLDETFLFIRIRFKIFDVDQQQQKYKFTKLKYSVIFHLGFRFRNICDCLELKFRFFYIDKYNHLHIEKENKKLFFLWILFCNCNLLRDRFDLCQKLFLTKIKIRNDDVNRRSQELSVDWIVSHWLCVQKRKITPEFRHIGDSIAE